MKNFQQKKKWRNILESKLMLTLLGVIILFFAWSVFGLVGKMQETIKNKSIAQEKVTELQKEKDKLTTDISKLSTEAGKEESIRAKFGWAKQGEGIIVVTDDTSTANATKAESSGGFFGWFKNLFK